MQDTERIYEI